MLLKFISLIIRKEARTNVPVHVRAHQLVLICVNSNLNNRIHITYIRKKHMAKIGGHIRNLVTHISSLYQQNC